MSYNHFVTGLKTQAMEAQVCDGFAEQLYLSKGELNQLLYSFYLSLEYELSTNLNYILLPTHPTETHAKT